MASQTKNSRPIIVTLAMLFVAVIVIITGIGIFLWVSNLIQEDQIIAKKQAAAAGIDSTQQKDMIVAGGCFWCVEADMEKAAGVIEVISGYSGGKTENPDYENYAEGGHREVVRVIYNPENVSFKGLLYYFIKHIDPTDGQGSFTDRGRQYSPAIYYATEEERERAEEVLADIELRTVFEEELMVPILPEQPFWEASEYHQNFYLDRIIQYKIYRKFSGRSTFIENHWGDQADVIPEISS